MNKFDQLLSRPPSGIRVAWKGPLRSLEGDTQRVQALIGQSDQGYHPGVRIYGGRDPVTSWGTPVNKLEDAAKSCDRITEYWLEGRHEELEHSPKWRAQLHEKADAQILKQDAPRCPEEEQLMLEELHKAIERSRGRGRAR